MARPVLVTGFRPYAGRGVNPAAEIATALEGRTIAGAAIVARLLDVSFADIAASAEALLQEINPRAVISIGLWPGEPVIRIERVGLNVADFEIADNLGYLAANEPVIGNGTAARLATLPVRAIEEALLDAGIPARISSTAGTYLCNACLYSFLSAADAAREHVACGFIHVPYLPSQVAGLIRRTKEEAVLEVHQRADTASMELATSIRAIEIAIAATVRERA